MTSIIVPDPKIVLCISASVADAAAVYPKGINILLGNGLLTFFINGSPVFKNGPRSLSRNHADSIILDNWVFDNLILVDKLFAKGLRRFKAFLLVNNNLWGNLSHHQNCESHLMIISKLFLFYFLLETLNY